MDFFKFSPLHLAIVSRTRTNLEDLISTHRDIIDHPDAGGRTPLHWAAMRRDTEKTSLLLAAGANPNATCQAQSNRTALFFAFNKQNLAAVTALLNCPRTNVNAMTIHGASVFHEMCQLTDDFDCWDGFSYRGSHDISKYPNPLIAALFYTLIDRGLDIHSRAFFGQSFIYNAIAHQAYTVLTLLFDNGVDYTTSDYRNQTMLHIAAKLGDSNVLRILRRYPLKGLDIAQRTTDGLTVVDMAEARKNVDQEWIRAFGELLESIEKDNDGQSSGLNQLEEIDEEEDYTVFHDAIEHQVISKE